MPGHCFTKTPQPIQSSSDIQAIFEADDTSILGLPPLTAGQKFLHSCLHFLGLHRSVLMRAGLSAKGAAKMTAPTRLSRPRCSRASADQTTQLRKGPPFKSSSTPNLLLLDVHQPESLSRSIWVILGPFVNICPDERTLGFGLHYAAPSHVYMHSNSIMVMILWCMILWWKRKVTAPGCQPHRCCSR
jgi:hypothetical protein